MFRKKDMLSRIRYNAYNAYLKKKLTMMQHVTVS